MIRRWSHINETNYNLNNYTKFEKKTKINIFKNSVNLKRFVYKITKFRRRGLSRFKHTANWLIYTNVIKTWSLDYIFNKNFYKNQFFYNIFLYNNRVYDFNFVKLRNENFFYNFNFLFSIFTKKFLLYFKNNSFFLFKNTPLTVISFYESCEFDTSIVPSLMENSFFFSLTNQKKESMLTNIFFYNDNFDFFFKNTLEFYKIINYLFINLCLKSNKFVFRFIWNEKKKI